MKKPLVNPTGGGIRKDKEGDGNYGAPRGSKRHLGIDLVTTEGQEILSPVNGTAVNFSGSTAGYPMVDITPSDASLGISVVRMLYVDALPGTNAWAPYSVTAGVTVVGTSSNLQSLGYSSGVTPHVHFQIKVGGSWVNPANFVELPP